MKEQLTKFKALKEASAGWPSAPLIDDQDQAFGALLKTHKISSEEYQRIKSALGGRPPRMAELGIFSAMWSEHCSYKSSRVHLKRFITEAPQVVVGPGENAGVVRLEGKLGVAFKMESHNHPSFIEPYQGAATGVGGILRDVFCMGARPIALLNALRFGQKTAPRMLHLCERVIKGIGDYGNCIGVPTVGGSIRFDASYDGNILVNAMAVGLIEDDKIFKGFASGQDNFLIYVGSATGRDGIHGATMASDAFSSQETQTRTTVQVGDPFAEKLLLEVTLELLAKGLVLGLQDMGAAGLTSSSFEMASRGQSGLIIDLDQVPTRAKDMTAYEMLLSESQERMLLTVAPDRWAQVQTVLDHWELPYAIIGSVIEEQRVKVFHKGILEADLPVGPAVDDAPQYQRSIAEPMPTPGDDDPQVQNQQLLIRGCLRNEDFRCQLLKALSLVGGTDWMTDQYDQDIGQRTVSSSRDGGAAVLWVGAEDAPAHLPYMGVAMAADCLEQYCAASAYDGALQSVMKCARMIAAAGAQPLAITDCLNFGNPTNPKVMRQLSDAVDGINKACQSLGVAVVSGNVSLYNETDGVDIHPTPMIGMVGRIEDVRRSRPARAKKAEDVWLICPASSKPFMFSVLEHQQQPLQKKYLLRLRENLNQEMELIRRLGQQDFLEEFAIRDLHRSGLFASLVKMTGPGFCFTPDHKVLEALMRGVEGLCLSVGDWPGAYLAVGPERAMDLARPSILSCGYEVHHLGHFKASEQTATTWLGYDFSAEELQSGIDAFFAEWQLGQSQGGEA